MGIVFRKAFRILGLGERYGLKDLFTLHKLAEKVVLDR